MTSASNDQGRAYEYRFLLTLADEIRNHRSASIIENSSFFAAQSAWGRIDADLQQILTESSEAAIQTLFDLEPLIIEDGTDELELLIQADSQGVVGDVRDILIIRRRLQWEIGLSMKHNHFAVKHSRLSKNLDFTQNWFGIPCSEEYWNDVRPIFERLDRDKQEGKKWRDLDDKEQGVYIPLLNAFVDEIKRKNDEYDHIPRKMVEYLLGEFDFYKVVSIDRQRITQIQTYNLHGTLNRPGRNEAEITVPVSTLPTRIVSLDFKPDSTNTVELYLDGGWQFSFRIHNAATKVESSLKFDVQIIGMPTTIITINCQWR